MQKSENAGIESESDQLFDVNSLTLGVPSKNIHDFLNKADNDGGGKEP